MLYRKNKKTKKNKQFKNGVEKVQLHRYLINCINDTNVNVDEYYEDFLNFFYTFYNKKYELNDTLNCKDGLHDTSKSMENNIKKRVFRYNQENKKRKINLNEHYQNSTKKVRMEYLSQATKENIDVYLDKVYEVYNLESLKKKIEDNVMKNQKNDNIIDNFNAEKIIRIYKRYYKNEVTKNFTEKNLIDTNEMEKKKQENEIRLFLMRLLNEYMKGRYIKARNAAYNGHLTKGYLMDIYEPENIKNKFKISLTNKIKLYRLNKYKINIEKKRSIDCQREKILQTYYLKLIDKIDYCSKLPTVNDIRVGDIFNILDIDKGKNIDSIFNKDNQKQFYFLEYFPEPIKYLNDTKSYSGKFYNSLKQLKDLRNEVLHSKHDLNKLFEFEDESIREDIIFLNNKQRDMILEKFKSNNIHKFFNLNEINQIYKKILPKNSSSNIELDCNYYNIYLPKFHKVYNEIIKDIDNEVIDKMMVEVINSQSLESELVEKKQSIKYFLQTLYYYGFSHVANNKKYGENKLNLEDFIVDNQRKSSIKGNSKKENRELLTEVKERFKEYLLEKEVKEIKMIEDSNVDSIDVLLKDIVIKEVDYCEKNILVNLGYYLDSKHLSQLIHDTKKLLQVVHDLDLIEKDSDSIKDILNKNIMMLNLNLMYKDIVKNISYKSDDCIKEEVKKLFDNSSSINVEDEEKVATILKDKKEMYVKYLEKLTTGEFNNYNEVSYNIDEKKQCLYVEGDDIITHTGIELFLKYNLSEFFNKLIDKFDLKIKKDDIRYFEKLKQVEKDNISIIEKKEKVINNFLNEFNKEIKDIQSVEIKKVIANKYKNCEMELNNERYTYDDLIEINNEKQTYHYINNKLKFNILNSINSFVDDVLSRLNVFMMYWERDANIIIEKFEMDNNINTNKYAINRIYNKKGGLSKGYSNFLEKEFNVLINMNINNMYEKIKYDEKPITALHIRNYLSHNNYYEFSNDKFNSKLSLLDLINIVHDIMSYNLKYQKDVLDVFNKILLGYRIGNEKNTKNKLPLKYSKDSSKIVINNDYFKPRVHNYFPELNLVSEEYCKIIKEMLNLKIESKDEFN